MAFDDRFELDKIEKDTKINKINVIRSKSFSDAMVLEQRRNQFINNQ